MINPYNSRNLFFLLFVTCSFSLMTHLYFIPTFLKPWTDALDQAFSLQLYLDVIFNEISTDRLIGYRLAPIVNFICAASLLFVSVSRIPLIVIILFSIVTAYLNLGNLTYILEYSTDVFVMLMDTITLVVALVLLIGFLKSPDLLGRKALSLYLKG